MEEQLNFAFTQRPTIKVSRNLDGLVKDHTVPHNITQRSFERDTVKKTKIGLIKYSGAIIYR